MRTARAVGARADRHLAVGRRVPHRVLDEVGDDLVQALVVAVERQVLGLHRHREADRSGVQPRLPDREVEHRADLEHAPVERHAARLEPRQVEQLLHEPAQPFDLGEHGAQRLGIGRFDAVDQVLEHRLQRGDRRPQLVAHVGDEVAADPVGLGELGRHLVERAGERADLVARGRGDALAEVAARHRRAGVGHLPQRRRHPAREEADDDERERSPR